MVAAILLGLVSFSAYASESDKHFMSKHALISVSITDKFIKCEERFGTEITTSELELETGKYCSTTTSPDMQLWAAYRDFRENQIGTGRELTPEYQENSNPQKKFSECVASFKSSASLATRLKFWRQMKKVESKKN